MNKGELKGYMEFFSFLPNFSLEAELADLLVAADNTSIHTFGWPIGLVLHKDQLKPKPFVSEGKKGIKFIYKSDDGQFDQWTLKENGDYYFLGTLFEDERTENSIFFDTRIVRATETFLRTANLYKALGVPSNQIMECKIEHGGLKGRVLGAASPYRVMFDDQVCTASQVERVYKRPIEEFIQEDSLKDIVFDSIKSITEMCDMWIPDKLSVVDPIVKDFLSGKIS